MPDAPPIALSNAAKNPRTWPWARSASARRSMLIQSGVTNESDMPPGLWLAHHHAPPKVTTPRPHATHGLVSIASAAPPKVGADSTGCLAGFSLSGVDVTTPASGRPCTRLPNHAKSPTTATTTAPVIIRLQEANTVAVNGRVSGSVGAQGACGTKEAKCPASATFKGAEPLRPPCHTRRPVYPAAPSMPWDSDRNPCEACDFCMSSSTPRTKMAPATRPRPQFNHPNTMLKRATFAGANRGVKVTQRTALFSPRRTGGANARTCPSTSMNIA